MHDEGVPHSLQPYPEPTLLDVVHDTAQQRPAHPVPVGIEIDYELHLI